MRQGRGECMFPIGGTRYANTERRPHRTRTVTAMKTELVEQQLARTLMHNGIVATRNGRKHHVE